MNSPVQYVFLMNLLQDVNVLRPLLYLARAEFDAPLLMLVSDKFVTRDKAGSWQEELSELAQDTGSALEIYESEWTAYRHLQGKAGVIFAGSETNLNAHTHTHNVLRVAPSSYLKVTLQHGYECPGFLQSRQHDQAHGQRVRFGADVICGWCEPETLNAIAASERSKLYVTGPSTLIPIPGKDLRRFESHAIGGLICENLHSVRLNVTEGMKFDFIEAFRTFCDLLPASEQVTLRPHPGGQYVVKNEVPLPENVRLNNKPIYKVDLRAFRYGISAPSSILIDMVLADIPTAVWQDEDALIDATNYRGLTFVSSPSEWMAFRRDAELRRSLILDRQHRYLESTLMLTDADTIRERFLRLLARGVPVRVAEEPVEPPSRILFVANGIIPTLQLSFLKPLAEDVSQGTIETHLLTEVEMIERFGRTMTSKAAENWVAERIEAFAPDRIVFCRYSGPHSAFLLKWARDRGVPTMFHVDDDLLHIPKEIGERKYQSHNRPSRLEAVRNLLSGSDLIYCSTEALRRRFRNEGFRAPMTAGRIYCSGRVMNEPRRGPVLKMGYMGFDHAHDFSLIVPALSEVLRRHPHVLFELFGPMEVPESLREFGDRISTVPPVLNYSEFLSSLAAREWDIGICPLDTSLFNSLKADTKWVEYTAVGAAVVATRGMAYDVCCADGCGLLASTHEEWIEAISRLCSDADYRYNLVQNAQTKLRAHYSPEKLHEQIYDVLAQAARHARRSAVRRLRERATESGSMEMATVAA